MNFPILSSIIFLPLLGALFIFLSQSKTSSIKSAIYVSLFTSIANFLLSIFLWYSFDRNFTGFQFIEDKIGKFIIILILSKLLMLIIQLTSRMHNHK